MRDNSQLASFASPSKSIPKNIIRDIAIIAIGILAIWAGLYVVFGMTNPFYVVASGSMIPELEVYDIIIVQGNIPFEDLVIGDVIVFDRPSDHNRVIVHRIVSVIDEDPRTIRTKGDANRASIPGTDYPITDKEYIGKVVSVVPAVGYVTQALKPPVNYIIIVIIIGAMVSKHFLGKSREKSDKEDKNKVMFSETAQEDITEKNYDDNDTTFNSKYDDNKNSKKDDNNEYDKQQQQHQQQQKESSTQDVIKEHDDSEYVADEPSSLTTDENNENKTDSKGKKEITENKTTTTTPKETTTKHKDVESKNDDENKQTKHKDDV